MAQKLPTGSQIQNQGIQLPQQQQPPQQHHLEQVIQQDNHQQPPLQLQPEQKRIQQIKRSKANPAIKPELQDGKWTGAIVIEGEDEVVTMDNQHPMFNQYLSEFLHSIVDAVMEDKFLDGATQTWFRAMMDIREYDVTYPQSAHQDTEHSGHNPFHKFPHQVVTEMIKYAVYEYEPLNRAIGAMVGMAVGDAVGSHLEFLPVVDKPFDKYPGGKRSGFYLEHAGTERQYKNPYNCFRLLPGQFTDDTSMGLCVADSLLKFCEYRGTDVRKRFHAWWYRGYNNTFHGDRTSVGLGGNIRQSLLLEAGVEPTATFEVNREDAGNGSLMRLAPIPVFFHHDKDMARDRANIASRSTHPGKLAAYACEFVSYLVASALQQPPQFNGKSDGKTDGKSEVQQWIDDRVSEFMSDPKTLERRQGDHAWMKLMRLIDPEIVEPERSKELCWNWRKKQLKIWQSIRNRGPNYNGYPVIPTYFGAFSMDGLAIALHCVYHTHSFDKCLEKVVNFLGDADSTGSIACQIAGAIHGYSTINDVFIKDLRTWDHDSIAFRGVALYLLGRQQSHELPPQEPLKEDVGARPQNPQNPLVASTPSDWV